jgi:hypothetical protein
MQEDQDLVALGDDLVDPVVEHVPIAHQTDEIGRKVSLAKAGFGAFAAILAGNRVDDEWQEVMRALFGVAMFPLFIGLAFLGLHFFANETKRRQG